MLGSDADESVMDVVEGRLRRNICDIDWTVDERKEGPFWSRSGASDGGVRKGDSVVSSP